MSKLFYTLLAATFLGSCSSSKTTPMDTASTTANALTEQEKREGWQLLFDGATTAGWHTYGKTGIGDAWKVADGALYFDAGSKRNGATGGDIVTDAEYGNFDLRLEWKIAPKGNSGIMFYVKEEPQYQYPWQTGPEIQVLDNDGHADAKITKHRAGDLYDLISVSKETVNPVGEWNSVRIVANGGKLDSYLNGEHVISTTMWNDAWHQMIAGSKFKDMLGFGKFQSGRISLQDHGDDVWFRNIKIKPL
ncbi:MAG: 3-keto-disaccharide hydrolase [Chitinophagaceae bacterium]